MVVFGTLSLFDLCIDEFRSEGPNFDIHRKTLRSGVRGKLVERW